MTFFLGMATGAITLAGLVVGGLWIACSMHPEPERPRHDDDAEWKPKDRHEMIVALNRTTWTKTDLALDAEIIGRISDGLNQYDKYLWDRREHMDQKNRHYQLAKRTVELLRAEAKRQSDAPQA